MSYEHRARGKYRVISEKSGQLLGTFYNDEGYKVMDIETLKRVLPEFMTMPLRITKIDWKNYDEVEIYVHAVDPGEQTELPDTGSKADMGPEKGICYVIYNHKDGESLGTFVTDEANSTLDKMVLYKMFPQFDIKSIRIVSLNWTDEGEVRVYIRGKKKEE